jgi:ubiquinone/menaquinone biosynthesis C-methylase UbiE
MVVLGATIHEFARNVWSRSTKLVDGRTKSDHDGIGQASRICQCRAHSLEARMPSTAYTDPRLAACYDSANPHDPADEFYLALAGAAPKTILDMGCGTGRLAVALAERGHRVTGADPSAGMMQVARNRPGAGRVRWVDSDSASLALETRFDLIIMTGHVFQVFLEDDEVRATLRTLRRHLAPGGTLAFETRNPLVEEWREWSPSRETLQVPAIGAVDMHYDVTSTDPTFVTFETHFRFSADDVVVATTTLRFMSRDALAAFLSDAGFTDLTWFGTWDRAPISATSPEIIVIAG